MTMNNIKITCVIFGLLLVITSSLFAQHSLQVDDGQGHYQIITASGTDNVTVTMPTVSGTILTTGSGGTIPSDAYIPFSNNLPRSGFTNTGVIQVLGNKWTTKANNLTAQRGSAVGVVDDKIYVIGGATDPVSGQINNNNCYDPSTDSWSAKAVLPTARRLVVGAVCDDIIYVIGGSIGAGAGTPQNLVEAYDPSTNTWATKAPMPTARWSCVATTINGKIYVTGGRANNTLITATEEYNPSTNTWATVAPIPNAYEGSSASEANGKMYVFGGNDIVPNNYSDNYEYTPPPTNSWATRTNIPSATTALAATTVNGNILFFGGCLAGVNTPFNSSTMYATPSPENYVSLLNMPTARINPVVATVNGKVYVIGGVDGNGTRLTTNEEYTTGISLFWFAKD